LRADLAISVRPYFDEDSYEWDSFCTQANQATLLHTRRFLSYHGDRFTDCSLLIENDGCLSGVFPAAVHPQHDNIVVSHPGATYGGIVHSGELRGERMLDTMVAIFKHFARQGFVKLNYKVVPSFYHRRPSQDDLYALFRLGAVRPRCDISSTIDLVNRSKFSERRRRGLKKALKSGVAITSGTKCLPAFWDVLSENLERKHGVTPVHTLAEMALLLERFPENIHCICGTFKEQIVSGVLLFSTPTADHAQYISSSDRGYELSALDLVFDHCISNAIRMGKQWFDFGISTESGGKILNEGLYRFKTEFGAGAFVHEFYEIDLRSY
jgi:hypothetical protein